MTAFRNMGTAPNMHYEPHQCLEILEPRWIDGGREEYLEQQRSLLHYEPERPTGDCAVVALVHAKLQPPNGQSYGDSRNELQWSIKPWMFNLRTKNEKASTYLLRRIRQWRKSPKANPAHFTPAHAKANPLSILGYQHVYPNDDGRWDCICDMECTYVLDVQIPDDHTMTIHQKIAYTTAPFDPKLTEVANVFRLDAKKTSGLKGWARYKEDESLWYKEWTESDGSTFPS